MKQQFQVIFYDNTTHTMSLPSNPNADWYRATGANIRNAPDLLMAQVPGNGTSHFPALREALRLRPQVLFFLTDGSDIMSAAQLETLRRLNGGRARIHCIKFDKLGDLGLDKLDEKAIPRERRDVSISGCRGYQ